MTNKRKESFKLSRLLVVIIILILIIGIVASLYWGLGLNKKFSDEEGLKEAILSYGNYSRIIYIILHFLQSTLLPISNFPTIVAGGYIYGPWENAFLTSIGVITGSLVAFGIGKLFGRPTVEWIVGKENTEKFLNALRGKEKIAFLLILILPFFPDDIICFIAGITLISWPFFTIAVTLLRPIPIILMCFLGTGTIIPFHGLGLVIWGVIILLFISAGHFLLKNWDKVNSFFSKVNKKFSDKNK